MPADPVAALVAYLKTDADVSTRVASRVFGGELPRAEVENMPRPCVVLKPAGGGLLGTAGQGWADMRVDVDCYGETPNGSWLLHLDVEVALDGLLRTVSAETLLHWARPSSRGVTARDPDTDWPVTVSSWQVLASRQQTA